MQRLPPVIPERPKQIDQAEKRDKAEAGMRDEKPVRQAWDGQSGRQRAGECHRVLFAAFHWAIHSRRLACHQNADFEFWSSLGC